MNRFLRLAALLLLLPAFPGYSATAQEKSVGELPARPNILWLTVEDIGPQLACYGDPTAATPHLDALAKKGMVYDLAWSNYPVCAPARTTIITGMIAASNGGGNMRSSSRLPSSIRMFPAILRENGYACFNNSKEDYNHPKSGQVWDQSSRRADYRKRAAGQPFFAVLNNTQTHESKIRNRPHPSIIDPRDVRLAPYWPDLPEVRKDWAQYYDNLMTMDTWVGKKLKELDEAGLADNTIVVFFGDHGSGMPRHKRYVGDSGMRVPFIVYVPEALKNLAPTDYVAGGRSDRPIGFVDLAPTMLSLAGVKPPSFMQGSALMGQHSTPDPRYVFGYRSRMDERIDLSRSVRDRRFLYIRNFMTFLPGGQELNYQMKTPTTASWKHKFEAGELNAVQRQFWELHPAEEFYDLLADPHETQNLIADPIHAADIGRLRAAMKEKTISIRDSGFIPESRLHTIRQTQTVREFCSDERMYPLEAIYEIACKASSGSADDLDDLLAAADSASPTVRYWSAIGLLSRGQAVAVENEDLIAKLADDETDSVAIVAAEILVRQGSPERQQSALARLAEMADLSQSDAFAALQALNAIERLGSRAKAILPLLKEVPVNDPSIKRGGAYPGRLISNLFPELERE